MRTTGSPTRLDALAGLRFFGALGVILLHLPYLHAYPRLHTVAESLGLRGGIVPFFFILSGCVFAYGYRDRMACPSSATLAHYYRSRFARIWPVHLFALMLTFAMPLGPFPVSAGPLIANALLMQTWVPSAAYYQSFDTVAWTLTAEMSFWLVLPAILYGVGRWQPRPRSIVMLAIGCWLPTFAFVWWHDKHASEWSLYLCVLCPLARVSEFVAGLCVGLLIANDDGRPDPKATRREWAVLGVLLVQVALAKKAPNLTLHNGYFTPVLAALVWVVARQRGRLSAWLNRPTVVYLGGVTYPLYLMHPFVVVLASQWLGLSSDWPVTRSLSILGASLAVAVVVHHAVEVPGQRWLGPRRKPVPVVAPPLAKAA